MKLVLQSNFDEYILDATTLIDLYNHFSNEFHKLRQFVKNDRAKISEGVDRELGRRSDKLFKTVNKWKKDYQQFVVSMNQDQRFKTELARIERAYGEKIRVGEKEYPGFWKSSAGKKSADGQIVAIGKVRGYIVVSDDKAVQRACMLEDVPCIGWTELARQIGMTGNQQQLELL